MPSPSPIAPWKPLLSHHLSLLKPPTFTLGTLSTATAPTNPSFHPPAAPPAPTIVPRVRTMIHRGFLGTMPSNEHNPLATHNPPNAYTSDCLTFTTDSRTTKIGEMRPPNFTAGGDARIQTGGGAPCEACFWISGDMTTGEDVQNQWRVRGKCYLLAEGDVESQDGLVEEVRKVLGARLVPTQGEEEGQKLWDWKKEVQRHWGNMNPSMRGSFVNPPPGVPLDVDFAKEFEWAKTGGGERLSKGHKVENDDVLKEDKGGEEGAAGLARRNFRLGVIVPDVVERMDLNADDNKARRWVWWRVEDGDGLWKWEERETWP